MAKLESRNSKLVPAGGATQRVHDFTGLEVWQLARRLRQLIYGLASRFPVEERFTLAQQIKRAAISVTVNIAEGLGRYSYQENIQFCRHARGSAYEVRDHLIAARDSGYIGETDLGAAVQLAQRVVQTLRGYIRSTQVRQRSEQRSEPTR